MKKIILFEVYKFQSKILDDKEYNISRVLKEARENKEIISIGDNQILRTIRDVRGIKFNEEELQRLEKLKKHILRKDINTDDLSKVQTDIDNIKFNPDYICIVVNDKKHYDYILENGLLINNIRYNRLLCSAGHARHSKVILINSEIEKEVKKKLNNNRNDITIEYAKYNAYFALSSSATFVIPTPKVCIIDDYIFNDIKKVNWVSEDKEGNYQVDIIDKELEFNAFDGQGIATPEYMKKIGEALDVDYIPSAMTLRNVFIKGMVCCINYKKFYKDYCEKHGISSYVTDIWGDSIDIMETDMILTKSQMKMWKGYNHWSEYIKGCQNNNLQWGCARITPKNDEMFTFSNYQYIQAINLNQNNIRDLVKPTVDWINNIIENDSTQGLLYLMGESIRNDLINNEEIYTSVNEDYAKALMINNKIINDPYIKQKIKKSLNKKIKDSKLGKILLRGNFQVMISDPFAFCEHLFGLPVNGLLGDKQHYAHFWNEIGSNKVVGMRSPLTWRSEVNNLNLIQNDMTKDWFQYLNSGIVYNIHGVDCMLHADSDYDFDIVCTTDDINITNNTYGGLPVTYNKNKAEKKLIPKDFYENIDEEIGSLDIQLGKIDELSFQNAIGRVTNYSTSMYALLPLFDENSKEYRELIKRLVITRKCQGDAIDSAKGIQVKPYPKEWYDYWSHEIDKKNDTDKIKEIKNFNISILADKKPYFMKYLYYSCNNSYNTYLNNKNFMCKIKFNCDIETLKKELNNLTDEEYSSDIYEDKRKFIEYFYKKNPLNTSDCTMNLLCKHMEKEFFKNYNDKPFDYRILLDKDYNDIEIDLIKNTNEYKSIYKIYKEFVNEKKMFRKRINTLKNNKSKYDSSIHYDRNIFYDNCFRKITSIIKNISIGEIAVISTIICYDIEKKNYDFLWEVCKEGLFYNLMRRNNGILNILVEDKNGDIEYLYKNYTKKQIKINEEEW